MFCAKRFVFVSEIYGTFVLSSTSKVYLLLTMLALIHTHTSNAHT